MSDPTETLRRIIERAVEDRMLAGRDWTPRLRRARVVADEVIEQLQRAGLKVVPQYTAPPPDRSEDSCR